MKSFNKTLSVFLVIIMLLASVPLQGFVGAGLHKSFMAKAASEAVIASDNCGADGDSVTTGYKREHVIRDWEELNQSYKPDYLSGLAVPMDGTNGTPDYLVPGQTENMIPQGMTYWPEKDWILVSSYDKSEENASVIFALDRKTGDFAAQFNLYTADGEPWKCHAGGIGVSKYNLYITSECGVAYFPLSDLDAESGTVKNIAYKETVNFGQLGKTYSAYISVSDGMLWVGNFYSNSPLSPTLAKYGLIGEDWVWKPNDEYYNAILGFELSGGSSKKEWAALETIKDNASKVINVDNEMDCIQGISFKRMDNNTYKMYLSRTTGGSLGASISVATVDLSENVVRAKKTAFSFYQNLPGAEGIVFIGDDLHILYEAGALCNYKELINKLTWNLYLKDCTDVIWKVNEDDLLQIPQVDDDWFKSDAYSGYNHELAQFCINYCVLGYCYNKAETEYYLNKSGFALKSCDASAGRDEVNYFIADKNISVNGVTKKLAFVGCIGSDKDQWYSNFDPLGKEREKQYADNSEKYSTHIGFADAKEFVYSKLKKYINNNPDAVFLLTGHSRGAATVNLLAAELIDNASALSINADNVYTYGFATPNTVSNNKNPSADKYKSIINIVNPEDLVTKLLPSEWDFARYGVTYSLPSKTNDKSYKNLKAAMNEKYKLLMNGQSYHPYPGGERITYNVVKSIAEHVKGIDFLYNEKFNRDGNEESLQTFMTRSLCSYQVNEPGSELQKQAQDLLIDTFLSRFSCSEVISDVTDYFVIYQGLGSLTSGWLLDDYFAEAHYPWTYMAYMMSMTSEQVTENRSGYKGSVN